MMTSDLTNVGNQNKATEKKSYFNSHYYSGRIITMSISLLGVIALFCRQYDIIKDNEPNNNKDKAKNSSECSTPEHPQGGLLRSNV